MCGIAGYVGSEPAAGVLLDSLRRLAYRGYDSSGIAVLDGDRIGIAKRAGKLSVLVDALGATQPAGCTGIAHTRWATHGGVTDANSHPHVDCTGDLAVVHNGIIENFASLKADLEAAGHVFVSETDTEVLPHLIEGYLTEGATLLEAVRSMAARIDGAAAVVILSRKGGDCLIGVRISSAGAVLVGYGEQEMLLASDLPALMRRTRRVVALEPGEIVQLSRSSAHYYDLHGRSRRKQPRMLHLTEASTEKGAYQHFMRKEIDEQPSALSNTMSSWLTADRSGFERSVLNLPPTRLSRLRRVILLGMGTSYHAALIGRTYFERLAGLPAEVDNASEFRYREAPIGPETLVVSVSQSGETVDTLAAMEIARLQGALQVTVCNVEGAQSTRVADRVLLTRCGPEVGVASTKTFSASVAALYLFAVWLGLERGKLTPDSGQRAIEDISALPALVSQVCNQASGAGSPFAALAKKYGSSRSMLFLGRGLQFPVALEGALKMKEIGYLHAEGYAAGEIKHGPIALIDRETPTIVLAPRDRLFEKTVSNIQQVKARGGTVIAVGTVGDEQLAGLVDDLLLVPPTPELLAPIVNGIPLQLLAYEVALMRGNDVDQPRNLAKTVTVL